MGRDGQFRCDGYIDRILVGGKAVAKRNLEHQGMLVRMERFRLEQEQRERVQAWADEVLGYIQTVLTTQHCLRGTPIWKAGESGWRASGQH